MRNAISIKEAEGKELERRVKAMTVAVRECQRAQIVFLAVDGMKQGQIAAEVGVSRVTVNHWRRRFIQGPGRRIPGGKSSFAASPHRTQLPTPSHKSRRIVHNRDGTD